MLTKNHYMNAKDRMLLLDLICSEQVQMIAKSTDNFESEKYLELERLKAKIRNMQ